MLTSLLVLAALLDVWAINWTLPSAARSQFYPDGASLITALPPFAILAAILLDEIHMRLAARLSPIASWSITAALLLPTLAYSANTVYLMTTPDIRDQAAAWIQAQVPAGQTIGICGAIYFDMPPMNADRYHIVQLAELGPDSMPAAVVLTSVNPACSPPTGDAYQRQVFLKRPAALWTWPVTVLPHDWQYTFHEISIYVRAS